MCGIPQSMMQRYLARKNIPSAEVVYQICIATGVSADWLFGLSDEMYGGSSRRDTAKEERIRQIERTISNAQATINEMMDALSEIKSGK